MATQSPIKLVLTWFQGHGLPAVNLKRRKKRMGIIVIKQGMGTLFPHTETTLLLHLNEAHLQLLGQVAGKGINQGVLLCILSLQGIQFLLRGEFAHLLDGLPLLSSIIGLRIDIQLLGLPIEDHLILGEDQFHVHGIDILLHIIVNLIHRENHHMCIVDLLPHYIGGLRLLCVSGPLHCVEDPHHQFIVGPVHHVVDHQYIPEGDPRLPFAIGLQFGIGPLLQQGMSLYLLSGEDHPSLCLPNTGSSHLLDHL